MTEAARDKVEVIPSGAALGADVVGVSIVTRSHLTVDVRGKNTLKVKIVRNE